MRRSKSGSPSKRRRSKHGAIVKHGQNVVAMSKPPSNSPLTIQKLASGAFSLSLRVDTLPPPPKIYTATMAFAEIDGPFVSMLFGERWPGEQALNSALLVRMSPSAVRDVLDVNPRFIPDVVAYARTTETLERTLDKGTFQSPPADRRAIENASVMAIAHSEQLASIRFYRLSPHAVHQLSLTGGASSDASMIEPLFEVILPAGVLAGLVMTLDDLTRNGGKA